MQSGRCQDKRRQCRYSCTTVSNHGTAKGLLFQACPVSEWMLRCWWWAAASRDKNGMYLRLSQLLEKAASTLSAIRLPCRVCLKNSCLRRCPGMSQSCETNLFTDLLAEERSSWLWFVFLVHSNKNDFKKEQTLLVTHWVIWDKYCWGFYDKTVAVTCCHPLKPMAVSLSISFSFLYSVVPTILFSLFQSALTDFSFKRSRLFSFIIPNPQTLYNYLIYFFSHWKVFLHVAE